MKVWSITLHRRSCYTSIKDRLHDQSFPSKTLSKNFDGIETYPIFLKRFADFDGNWPIKTSFFNRCVAGTTMQSEASLAVKCMLRDSNVDTTIPTVYFGYNKREFNGNKFYCYIVWNLQMFHCLRYVAHNMRSLTSTFRLKLG
jgi:hypothetical protein